MDQSGNSAESTEDDYMDKLDEKEEPKKTTTIPFLEDAGSFARADITENIKKQIGMNCGSTATVLLINPTKMFIAHVGDTKCVACIKGQAADFTLDHRPSDLDEYDRITNAGGTISEDGRIEGDIDMSRAFGDFRYKKKDDPFQILSVEPSISSIEISPDLEFIIIASDGIWNTMDKNILISFIKDRISEPNLELQDLCGELFEELLPQKITPDGSGCDNMTAIIIKFQSLKKIDNRNTVTCQQIYEYRYPTKNSQDNSSTDMSNNSSTTENSKNCKERGQLKLDEANLNNEIFTNVEKINSEMNDEIKIVGDKKLKIFEEIIIFSDQSNSSQSSGPIPEYHVCQRYLIDERGNKIEFKGCTRQTETDQDHLLYRPNIYFEPSTSMAAGTDHQEMNPSSILQHANNVSKIMLNHAHSELENSVQSLNSCVSTVKTEVGKEINSSIHSIESQNPEQDEVARDVVKDEDSRNINSVVMQAPTMQKETDSVVLSNEKTSEGEDDSQCVESADAPDVDASADCKRNS